ncbi:putative short-chain dehydrogenase [Aspergillus rambellii]|uniref:Putative short-chain dehydrogenase n=1 Tax=Aspergillus rambellii TaxID=308745 RepID=A0A0F8V3X1_9EURO|nr:putative short-chain dehydrogenase [Aspergillus rambellii]
MSIAGKTALITGGVKNLGAQIAREFAGAGANLALHYHSASSQNDAATLEAELRQKYPDLKEVLQEFGKIDIVVNTIGKVLKKPITEITEEEYDSMFAINSKTAFFVLKEAAIHVSDGGKIITIVTALLGAFTGYYTSYAGSKAPVEHFTRGVCKELQSRQVSVNNIAPGPMDTPFFYPQESPEAVAFHKSNGMGNRLTMVEDIAPLALFLCTGGAWITGQTIFANGGYTTR